MFLEMSKTFSIFICSTFMLIPSYFNISFFCPINLYYKSKHLFTQLKCCIPKNIFACLFSIHNKISLSRHEQVYLSGLRFERPDDRRSISRNVAHLNILVYDVVNLLYKMLYPFCITEKWLHLAGIPNNVNLQTALMIFITFFLM